MRFERNELLAILGNIATNRARPLHLNCEMVAVTFGDKIELLLITSACSH
jgi:hypothetical protein